MVLNRNFVRYLKVEMGDYTDYFKPVDGASWCDMLESNDHHMWSRDGENWVVPPYYSMHRGGSMHGSAGGPWHRNGWNNGHEEWERLNGFFDSLDERVWLPFWGSSDRAGHIQYGGCCHEDVGDRPSWGRAFDMYIYYCAGSTAEVEAEGKNPICLK